jgi:zinc D-Ala-D-Ala carboxypeptidase
MYDFSKIKNFKESEFKCKCCGKVKLDMDFIRLLDYARNYAGVPFNITSGYRCSKHNANVGGVIDSSHLQGCAADIETENAETRLAVTTGLCIAGFERILQEKTWIHVDTDFTKPSGMFLM